MKGMLWYYHRAAQRPCVPVPVRVPVLLPVPVLLAQTAPRPVPSSPSTGWQPPSRLGPVVGGVVVGGVALIVGTLAEDVVTGGAGILDDPVTLTAGGGMVLGMGDTLRAGHGGSVVMTRVGG